MIARPNPVSTASARAGKGLITNAYKSAAISMSNEPIEVSNSEILMQGALAIEYILSNGEYPARETLNDEQLEIAGHYLWVWSMAGRLAKNPGEFYRMLAYLAGD